LSFIFKWSNHCCHVSYLFFWITKIKTKKTKFIKGSSNIPLHESDGCHFRSLLHTVMYVVLTKPLLHLYMHAPPICFLHDVATIPFDKLASSHTDSVEIIDNKSNPNLNVYKCSKRRRYDTLILIIKIGWNDYWVNCPIIYLRITRLNKLMYCRPLVLQMHCQMFNHKKILTCTH
jgi:hypothetical protein